MSARKLGTVVLAVVALLGLSSDAFARRHVDGQCRTADGGWRMCAIRGSRPVGPMYLSVQPDCRGDWNVLAVAKATDPSKLRRLTLTLDGVTLETTKSRGPKPIAVGIDCASLSVGPHTLTATLTLSSGERVSLSKTLTRFEGPAPDDLF